MLPAEESQMAKVVSLAVKFGALVFVLKLPATYAIEMQLLGGIWIGQLFPSVVIGVFTRWFHPWGLFAGWLAGMVSGSACTTSLAGPARRGTPWTLGAKAAVRPVTVCGVTLAWALNFLSAICAWPTSAATARPISPPTPAGCM